MIIPIVGPSALEFWLSGMADLPIRLLSEKSRRISLPADYHISHRQVHYQNISAKLGLSLPVYVMANKETDRGDFPFMKPCIRPKHLPDQSFIQLNDLICISSPELCFVQMARILPIAKLIEVANNLCAIYALDNQVNYGFAARDSIIKPEDIVSFLQRAKGLSGIKKARQGFAYISDRSRSPMESKLAALAAMPLLCGGYHLPGFRLNWDVSLEDNAAKLLGRKSCCCDMVWEDQKVIVEYDSNLSHLSADQHAYDKSKTNALILSGYKTFFATADNMKNFKSIEEMFLTLRKMLGLRPLTPTLSKYESIRHETVRSVVFDSWKKYL